VTAPDKLELLQSALSCLSVHFLGECGDLYVARKNAPRANQCSGGTSVTRSKTMIHFRVYLRSELGKLSDIAQAQWFLHSVSSAVLQQCELPIVATELAARLGSQEEVDAFVASLRDDQLRSLTKTCDRDWRKNHVFEKLSKPRDWVEADVAIDSIDVQQAEHSLCPLFKRHDYHLSLLIKDPALGEHESYKSCGQNRVVAFPVCLALLSNGRYRLFDGIHRAIQMGRNGEQLIRLVYAVERS
jgi:hypothetical protein